MLSHSERTTAVATVTRPEAAAPPQAPSPATADVGPRAAVASDDRLALMLARAVQSRAGAAPPRLLQRFYDPKLVTHNALQPAIDYVWAESRRIAENYRVAFSLDAGDETIKRVLRGAFALTTAGPAMTGMLNRLAIPLATGKNSPGGMKDTLQAGGQEQQKATLLASAVRALNLLEQDTISLASTQVDLARKVLVGTEFSFSNTAIEQTDPDDNATLDPALKMIASWEQTVSNHATLKPAKIKKIPGKADKGTDNKNARKFIYTLGPSRTWWWVLDIDPACLETQTMPTTMEDLSAVQHIIQSHIFGIRKQLGLKIDVTDKGGGGHISLDMATLFGGSADLLLELLSQLQDDVVRWDEYFKYTDAPNAAWLKDEGTETTKTAGEALTQFKVLVQTLVARLDEGTVTFDEVTSELKDFHAGVVNMWATNTNLKALSGDKTEQKQQKAEKRHAQKVLQVGGRAHYQAVNVEHLVKPAAAEDEGRRRLELRAIGAQKSTDRVLADLRFIYGLIGEAQAAVADKLWNRRATIIG